MPRPPSEPKLGVTAKSRIDKWLWAERFYRARSLAAAAVEAGQVRLGGERVKPARPVHAGEVVSVRKRGVEWSVEVTAVAEKRGSASDAAKLYRETDQSRALRENALAKHQAASATEPGFDGRPSKRDRRKLLDFLDER